MAVSVKIVDRALYHQRVQNGGSHLSAAAASVVVCWLLGLMVAGTLVVWVLAWLQEIKH